MVEEIPSTRTEKTQKLLKGKISSALRMIVPWGFLNCFLLCFLYINPHANKEFQYLNDYWPA